VGLISKAIEKVEDKENPITQQETPPRPKRKKRFLIFVAILLFIGTSLGGGYLFLLKPTSEVPPSAARRSINAKKRPAKPASLQSEQKKDTVEVEATAEKTETATKGTLKKFDALPNQVKEAGIALEQKEETVAPEKDSSFLLTENTSFSDEESEIPESEIEEVSELPISSDSQEEKSIPLDVTSSEVSDENFQEDVADETTSFWEEESVSEEVAPSYADDLKKWLVQQSLTVTERSDSRAQRYYAKGLSYQQQGELERAIDSYRSALTFNPDHLEAHINLATAYLQTGRFKEAEKELIYVYALKPNDRQILFNFGLLMYQTGEYASAETKLKKLLESDPFHLEANLLLACVYEATGEPNKAIEYCMKAYRINSTDPRVLYQLGRAWDMAGEGEKAVEYYQLFLKNDSQKENQLKSAVRDRMKYLAWRKGEK
jgi:tetratricopeptide (TPR) repeat protein